MPRPPAWVTAAASFPPAAEPIGASRIGCWIPSKRVNAVSMVATGASRTGAYSLLRLWQSAHQTRGQGDIVTAASTRPWETKDGPTIQAEGPDNRDHLRRR